MITHIRKKCILKRIIHKCDLCEEDFPTRISLKKHRLTHMGENFAIPLELPLSDNENAENLDVPTHTSETPFKCDLCSKSFRHEASLVIHQQVHTS